MTSEQLYEIPGVCTRLSCLLRSADFTSNSGVLTMRSFRAMACIGSVFSDFFQTVSSVTICGIIFLLELPCNHSFFFQVTLNCFIWEMVPCSLLSHGLHYFSCASSLINSFHQPTVFITGFTDELKVFTALTPGHVPFLEVLFQVNSFQLPAPKNLFSMPSLDRGLGRHSADGSRHYT